MPRERVNEPTRQLYAQIREDIYLAAKGKAAELRIPLREFIENALSTALNPAPEVRAQPTTRSVWDDEYLTMQERQPFGSPIELTADEADAILKETVLG